MRLGGLELFNRIVIVHMCQYSATGGSAGDWHTVRLGHLTLSGAGVLIMEATGVAAEARISPADLGRQRGGALGGPGDRGPALPMPVAM